jgi:alkylated DNA repair dioxygenase AlkB
MKTFETQSKFWQLDERSFNAFVSIAQPVQFKMFGKHVNPNRTSISYRTGEKDYEYPGSNPSIPLDWDGWGNDGKDPWGEEDVFGDHNIAIDEISMLMEAVNEQFDENLNYALVNVYHDGDDYMGFHRDDKIEEGSSIYSLSFGETRKMVFKNNDKKHEIHLDDGMLLKFTYEQNKEYKHSIPKQKNIKGRRINITLRTLASDKKARAKKTEPKKEESKENINPNEEALDKLSELVKNIVDDYNLDSIKKQNLTPSNYREYIDKYNDKVKKFNRLVENINPNEYHWPTWIPTSLYYDFVDVSKNFSRRVKARIKANVIHQHQKERNQN